MYALQFGEYRLMDSTQSQLKSLKILVIDDHEAVIGGTRDAISKQYPEASVFQAKTAENALEQVNSLTLDLAITDFCVGDLKKISMKEF